MISSEVLIQAVQKVYFAFEADERNQSLSIQDIADRSKSSYSTISALKKNKIKNLSVKKALEISSALGGPKDLAELVAVADETQVNDAREFAKSFPHLSPYEMQPEEYDVFFKDKDYARIIWAAFGENNISKAEINKRWGEEGSNRLEILIASGLLYEEDGIIKGSSESAGFGLDSTYKQLRLAIDLYSPINREKAENWLSFQTQSVNSVFISEMREEMRTLFTKFHEKSNSFKYFGNQRMFFGMVFDRYVGDLNEDGRGPLQ